MFCRCVVIIIQKTKKKPNPGTGTMTFPYRTYPPNQMSRAREWFGATGLARGHHQGKELEARTGLNRCQRLACLMRTDSYVELIFILCQKAKKNVQSSWRFAKKKAHSHGYKLRQNEKWLNVFAFADKGGDPLHQQQETVRALSNKQLILLLFHFGKFKVPFSFPSAILRHFSSTGGKLNLHLCRCQSRSSLSHFRTLSTSVGRVKWMDCYSLPNIVPTTYPRKSSCGYLICVF